MSNIKNNNSIFNIKETGIMNGTIPQKCHHYDNNLEIYAECCGKFFSCNKCHNEICSNKMYNVDIKKIRCRNCKTIGFPGKECSTCKIPFAKNICLKCNIWCNKIGDMYHCEKCNCCRKGNECDYFHCNKCDLCLSNNCMDNHVCFKYDRKTDCPICLEKIFKSGDDIILLKCNHLLHKNCFNELIKSADERKVIPQCTLCKKSAVNVKQYENRYDNHVNKYPMPEYYKNWKSEILCNDCCCKSTVCYHKDYQKCYECKSYNTSTLNIIK
jgi:RING finger/CHY zinc finger protein 1